MTTYLAIDTSTSRTSVAVVIDNQCVWTDYRDGATEHGQSLATLVKAAISDHQIIDSVVVGMGPGPYTGLRIGISFARTFALAREIDVNGVNSLDALALNFHSADFIVATDARRKEIYWARYTNSVRVEGPSVDLPETVKSRDLPIYGEGAMKYSLGAHENAFPNPALLVTLASDPKNFVDEPLYLRRPDAVATVDRA